MAAFCPWLLALVLALALALALVPTLALAFALAPRKAPQQALQARKMEPQGANIDPRAGPEAPGGYVVAFSRSQAQEVGNMKNLNDL